MGEDGWRGGFDEEREGGGGRHRDEKCEDGVGDG